jgi:hypothetical protein
MLSETLPDRLLQRLRLLGRDAAGIHPIALYRVYDRQQTFVFIVAATNSETALDHINELGMGWTLGTTVTKSIQRNVIRKEGIVDVCELNRFEHFRDHQKRARNRRARAEKRGWENGATP